jgi:hypothetical protein
MDDHSPRIRPRQPRGYAQGVSVTSVHRSILVRMLTSACVAACRARIDEDVAAALALFEGERYAALRDRIRAEQGALRGSLLAAELTLPRNEWSAELIDALADPDPLLLLAAAEAGIDLP